MLTINSTNQIFLYTPAADMRKGIDGLSGIVRAELNADPTDGSLFVFVNRRRDRMKILQFADGGFWLYYRVLEAGTFERLQHSESASHLTIDSTQLAMLLSGVSLIGSNQRRKRYGKQAERAA
jgi:transposase